MFSPLWQEVKIFYGVVDFVVCNGYNMGRILLPLRTIENSFCKFSIVMNQGGVVMNIRPSAAIRQNYNEIADMCRKTAEPVFLTKNGEGDLVVMDIETYNRREKMLKLREELLAVEEDRIAGRSGCTLDELDAYLDEVIAEV
jgi:prevent-host-death family protein